MAIEKIGLMAVFETAEFQKGLDIYLKGLAQVNSATDTAQTSTQKGASGVAGFGGAAAAAIGGVTALASAGISLAVSAFGSIVNKAGEAIGAIKEFGTSALYIAGRVDQLNRIAFLLGERMGYSQDQVEGFIDTLMEGGIRSDVAAGLVASFARKQLDLAKSTELAAMAQNAATFANVDSSDALDTLNTIVVTGNRLMARRLGLEVDFTAAQDALAQSLGTTREQLTETERAQANLDAVLAQGASIAGAYAVSQQSPTKALKSLGRQIFDLQAVIGAPFLSAWKSIIDVMRAAVSAITEMVSEGGLLYPILVNLGAAASILADGFKTGAMAVIDFFRGLRLDVREGLVEWIEEAFTFGAELVATFADGMISSAAEVLTVAMNAIQNMLTYWLAPGSPPKVVPHIDKWGAATFTEYMKGFSDADFGVLTGLQSILGKILDKPELQSLSIDISGAIAEGGPDEAFFSKLRTATGDFGNEVVKLAENYFELASAQEESERAQNMLNDAMNKMAEAESTVDTLTQEYNRLLRAGASDEVLDAQLAQINAAEEQLRLAREQKNQAEENIKTSEERIKAIAEETGLQEELVNQLLALAAEQEKAGAAGAGARAGERAAGGAGGLAREVGGLGAGIGGAMGEGITTGIQDAIENAKKLLLEKLGRIFAPLKRRWEESIKPTLTELYDRFQEFRDNVTEAWDVLKENIGKVVDDLSLWWEVILPDAITILKTAIDNLKTKFQVFWNYITITLIPKLQELANNAFGAIRDAIATIADKITGEGGLIDAFKNLRDFVAEKLSGAFQAFKETYVDPLTTAFSNLWDRLDAVNRIIQIIKQTIDWILGHQSGVGDFGGGGGAQPDTRRGFAYDANVVPVTVNVIPATATTGGNTTTNSFNFGGNTISDGIDLLMFEEMIVRVLRRELSR